MTSKILVAMLLAGTVVGCASNPPPPPPMAAAPEPAPMAPPPPPGGPMMGTYKAVPELVADAPASCRKVSRPVTLRVMRNNSFTLMGTRGMIGPDGAIMATGRNKASLSGMASPAGLDITTTGKCGYHYMFAKG